MTCSLSTFEKKEELFQERDHCTSVQATVITGSMQNLNGSRQGVGIVGLELPSWQVTPLLYTLVLLWLQTSLLRLLSSNTDR